MPSKMTFTAERDDKHVSGEDLDDNRAPYMMAAIPSGMHLREKKYDEKEKKRQGRVVRRPRRMDTLPSTNSLYEIIAIPKDCQDRELLYNQCIQIRTQVFVHELEDIAPEDEIEEADLIATHFLLRSISSKAPIGTSRIHQLHPDASATGTGCYKLGRVALLKEHRKRGLGASLVKAVHQHVRDNHKSSNNTSPSEIMLHSRLPLTEFYARLGYVPEGDEFEEDGAPHRRMRIHLDN